VVEAEAEKTQDAGDDEQEVPEATPLNALQVQEMADNTIIENELQNLELLEVNQSRSNDQIITEELSASKMKE
jgi:hypothetical protein